MQDDAIAKIKNLARNEKGKIFVIYGHVRTGKGTIFERLKDELIDDSVVIDYYGGIDEKIHPVHKNLIRFDTDADAKYLESQLPQIREFLKENTNNNVVVELLHEQLFPMNDKSQVRYTKEYLEKFPVIPTPEEKIKSKNPDLVLVKTAVSLQSAKKAFWGLNEKLVARGFAETGSEIIKTSLFSNMEGKAIDDIAAALNQQNERAYDAVFERLEKIEQQSKREI